MKYMISAVIASMVFVLGSDLAAAQSTQPKSSILVVDGSKVKTSDFINQGLKFFVSGTDTGGRMTVWESTEHPGFKTQWHSHNNSEETFYVLEGVLTIKSGGKTFHVNAGSFVFVPRGTPHGQGNFTDKPVRFITTVTPAGIEAFFHERDKLLKGLTPSDPQYAPLLQQVREKHKYWVEPLGTWEPDSKP